MSDDPTVIDPTTAFAAPGGGLRATVENSSLPVTVVDASTVRILYTNEAAARIARLPMEAIVGRSLHEFAGHPDKVRDSLTLLMSGAIESYQAPRVFHRADGTTFAGRVWVRMAEDAGRKVFVVVFTDERSTSAAAELPLGFVAPPTELQIVPGLDLLTGRETEVLERLVAGARVPQIAEQMFLAPPTVRNHLSAIYRKLGVHSQADLVALLRPSRESGPGSARRGGD